MNLPQSQDNQTGTSGTGRDAPEMERRLASMLLFMQIHGMASAEKNTSIKKAAARMVRQLPESANWDDLMYEILVRQKIEAGLADIKNGRKHDHADVRREFGAA